MFLASLMRAFCIALLLLLLDTPGLRANDLTIVQPRDQGLVLGDTALVEIKGTATPVSCRLDGVACVPSGGWVALPYSGCWAGEFPVARNAHHELELFPASGASAVVHFDATPGGSVALGDEVLRHFLDKSPPQNMSWNWGPGVFLHGLHGFAQVSPQKTNYLNLIETYYRQHLAQGLPSIDRPDMCAPAMAALELARTDGIKTGLPAAAQVASYIRSEKRDALGAIDHLGSNSPERFWAELSIVLAPWAHSIWVDSLMMYGVFSAEWGNSQGEPALLDFGAEQPRIFADVLQDPVSGLFTHAWDLHQNDTLGAKWLRGNGWVGASTLEVLDELPAGDSRRARLEQIYQDLAKGFLAKQNKNGLWDTLVGRPGEGYSEVSGSALAAYALAKGAHAGIAPPGSLAAARRAFEAIVARMTRQPDGFSLTDISEATNPFPEWVYTLVPKGTDIDYGVGAFLLLAKEMAKETWP